MLFFWELFSFLFGVFFLPPLVTLFESPLFVIVLVVFR